MANRQYTVSAVVDSNKLQKSAQTALSTPIKINVNTSQLSSDFKKISQTAQFNVNATVNGQKIENATKILETWSNDAGKTVQVTKILNQENEQVSQSISKIGEKLTPFAKDMKTVRTETKTYTDELGRTVTESTKFNSAGEQLGTTTTRISENLKKAKTSTKEVGDEFQKTSNKAKSFGKDFISTLGKVAKFYAITKIIQTFTQGIDEAVQAVKQLDDVMVDYAKVSDLSGEALTNYTNKLGELGKAVYRNKIEMTESATLFKQAGFTDEDSAQLAQMANLYMNIADGEISAGDSASFIISQMKAFNITAEDSIHILDAVNIVSNNYAVSSSDLANNISKVSSTLSATGTSFEQTLGLMTAITEKTRNASTASRGLKQISSRLTQTLDASSGTGKKLVTIYDQLNISLKDSHGQIRSTYDILADLSTKWQGLSKNQQEYIALTSAGSNQVNNFLALMQNFDTAISATETALDSSGSAWKENSKRAESLTSKLSALKAEFINLVTGDGGLSKFLKSLVDIGTAIISFVNKGKVLQVLLVDLSIILAVKLIPKLILMALTMKTKILKVIPDMITGITLLIEAISKGGEVITTTNLMIEASIPIIGLVLVAISALVMGYSALKSSQKETKKTTEELNSEYEESKNKLDDLKNSLDDVNSKIEAIKSQGTLSITDKDDLTNLRIQKEELETQLVLQKAINEEKQKALEKEAKSNVYKKIKTPYVREEHTYTGDDVNYGYSKVQSDYKNVRLTDSGTTSEGESYISITEMESADKVQQLKAISKEMLNQQNIIDNLSSKKEKNKKLTKDEQIQLDRAITSYKDAREIGSKYADDLNQQTINLDKNSETRKYALQGIDSFTQGISSISSATSNATGYSEDYDEILDEEAILADALTLALETLSSQLKDLTSIDLSGIEEAFDTINQAQTELNSASGLTLGTYENLISLGSEYLSVLFDEQGNLRNTADAERELYYAKIDEMAITQAQALIKKAVETENQSGADSYANYANSIYETTDALWGSVYATLASQQAMGSLSKSSYQAVLSQVNSLRDYANQAKHNITTMGGYTKATNDNTSATK